MKNILLFLLLGFFSVFSQSKKIDSLELILQNYKIKDTLYVNLLNEIATKSCPNDIKNALLYVVKSQKISDSLNYVKGKAEAYYVLAKVKTIQLEYGSAKENLNKAIDIFTEQKDDLGVAKSLSHLGIIYYSIENYEKALNYFYKSLDANKIINDSLIFANANNNIGNVYNTLDQLDNSNQYYQKTITYYYKSLKIYRKLGDAKYEAIILNNLGTVYNNKKLYDEALIVYNECLSLSIKNNDEYLTAYTSQNLAVLYQNNKEFEKAKMFFFDALNLFKKNDHKSGICNVNSKIGRLYIELNMNDKALIFLKKSEKIADKYDLIRHKMQNNEMLALIYEEKGDFNKALNYYKEFKKNNDSIKSYLSNNKLIELEEKYKFKKEELLAKDKEIRLNEKIKLTNRKLENTKRQVLYGLFLVLFLIVILGFVVYNSRIKRLSSEYQKVVLKQKLLRSQMKPHFIFNSLSVLQGIVLHKEYDKASIYISKFSRLLRKILETSREEIINLETEIRIIENYIFLRNISDKFSNCSYSITIDEQIDVNNIYIPPMIVQPFVENSFEHGFIELNRNYNLSIDFKFNAKKLVCTITDDGEGLNDNVNRNYFEKKKSFSSSIIQERLELFSKKYKEKYNFKVIDRKIDGLKGTQVVLLLPYKIKENG